MLISTGDEERHDFMKRVWRHFRANRFDCQVSSDTGFLARVFSASGSENGWKMFAEESLRNFNSIIG